MVNQVRQIITNIVRRVPLAQGQHFVNCATGQKSGSIAQLPAVVFVFAMGGGTFIEHELMQNLAKELQKA